MNWLAHLVLARDAPALRRLGNLAGDFLRGSDIDGIPPAMREGIEDHRAVDHWTDSDPGVRALREELATAGLGRYAGVAIDMWFDHLLARTFQDHSSDPDLAIADVERMLADDFNRHRAVVPPRLAAVAPRIVEERWFQSYATTDGIDRALRGLSRRASRQPNPLDRAATILAGYRPSLASTFGALFPRLRHGMAQRLRQ